ncbi:MAG: hypothetical protein JXR77_03480 [Lentisphaeria bacterium]|nr:hypothetical protein [Lentisphaeria bacterium]
MSAQRRVCGRRTVRLAVLSMAGVTAAAAGEASMVVLRNPSFEGGMRGPVPDGWVLYAGGGAQQSLSLIRVPFAPGQVLLLDDRDPERELGLSQDVAAAGGRAYEASVAVAAVPERPAPVNVFLQLRFLPSNTYVQTHLATNAVTHFERRTLVGRMPEGDHTLRLYLYTHRGPPTTLLLDDVRLRGGVPPPPAPVTPPPGKAPPIARLKELCLETPLATAGEPRALIVVPADGRHDAAAAVIQAAVREVGGCVLPLVPDDDPRAALPLTRHVVVLGNRSDNRLIGGLYEAYFALEDLRYPGAGGHILRSLHNPYGNGCNAILAGGSDGAGVAAAAEALSVRIRSAGREGAVVLGHILEVLLGKGLALPEDPAQAETWEASEGYGSVGYFGWNSLSKRMALYAMTGEPRYARDFLRLAFPDEAAIAEISRVDGERIENKRDPLAGAYHYNQHLLVLFWDLIEESPVFSAAERLRVTQALARQLEHDDYARRGIYALTGPADSVPSRHGQWAAIGLYCLGRYFQRDYPDPVWEHCLRAGTYAFASLHNHAWIQGESDNLFWYSTGIAPIFTYLCLTGDRAPVENGVLGELLRGFEILLNGRPGDSQLRSASLGFLHKAAHVTGDGRWITYRERTRMDTDGFRLGQSYWPDESLRATLPPDLDGRWSVQSLPQPLWLRRGSGLPFEQSFLFGSFRTDIGPGGDFVLLDGFNGASRNPYHTFAILALRLGGTPLLEGYLNQVLTKADGMVKPAVPMDAALAFHDRVGATAAARGDVPGAAFCTWRRMLLQRLGCYALIVDHLTFRTDSANMAVQTLWETAGGTWSPDERRARIGEAQAADMLPDGWNHVDALDSQCRALPAQPDLLVRLESLGIVLLRAREPGARLELPFHLDAAFRGEMLLDTVRYLDRGAVRILLDGRTLLERVSLHAAEALRDRISLGEQEVPAGDHTLTLEVVAHAGDPERCYAAVGRVLFRPSGALPVAAPGGFALSTCDPLPASGNRTITMLWTGPVRSGEDAYFFHLLAPVPPGYRHSSSLRLAPRAAALRLPEPALAVMGDYRAIHAAAAILATTHLYGRGMTAAGLDTPLLQSTEGVVVDWDFATGRAEIEVHNPTLLELRTAAAPRLDGAPQPPGPLRLGSGRHVLENAFLEERDREALAAVLGGLTEEGLRLWAEREAAPGGESAALQAPAALDLAPLAQLPGPVTAACLVPDPDGGTLLALARERTVHRLAADGNPLPSLETDGPIRLLHWWPEADLLLAGCADETLIAFGRDGSRRWVFTSAMDPAVFRAAKTYWFKSAPGHGGIHGVATGPFIDGRPQCVVGSACTAEILECDGSLARRLPVFWGPGKIIRIVPAADGSHDALIARWPNGTDEISIINSRRLDVGRGFYGVPPGHTMIGGWSAQNRAGLLWEDVNRDGNPELVSATNGRWNRVTVFAADGRPLANAQFGPAPGTTFRAYIRDLAILRDEDPPRILVATHDRLLVALDPHCRRLWSRALLSPPRRLLPLADGRRCLVGCDDGALVVLDGDGGLPAAATAETRVDQLLPWPDGRIAVATAAGRILLVDPGP